MNTILKVVEFTNLKKCVENQIKLKHESGLKHENKTFPFGK